jgi:hypothetical protein
MFLQTVIKELNLKFKTEENPRGIKRVMIILKYRIRLKSWIMLKNMETGQLEDDTRMEEE